MRALKALAVVASLVAPATTATASVIYATSVDSYTIGGNTVLGGIDPARTNSANALGAPDGQFASLGLGGEITVSFGQMFKSPGRVWEITFGNRAKHLEKAEVYVGLASVFTLVGQVTNGVLSSPFTFVGLFDQVRVVDISPGHLDNRDGYDVDAIGVSAIPLPAAGLMLLTALGAVTMLRRRIA